MMASRALRVIHALGGGVPMSGFVDIHCHLLPGIDDGASDLQESLAMAQMSLDQGVDTIVVTPHQCGAFAHNSGDDIRQRTAELQEHLDTAGLPLRVLPGADVRIEDDLVEQLSSGNVLSLGDHGCHVLLELPHEIYFPLEPVLEGLRRLGMVGILSHPERNGGLLQRPTLINELIKSGCLMQVTAGSFLGAFGKASQAMAEQMAREGAIHFVSTDAHGPKSRRPRMRDAYQVVEKIVGPKAATLWCREFPKAVAEGRDVPCGFVKVESKRSSAWSFWGRKSA